MKLGRWESAMPNIWDLNLAKCNTIGSHLKNDVSGLVCSFFL